ncbi:MAG: hypothetical protein JW782_03800 [Candidatus Saganbacteria bacterium]|nr:hypothetical protein [Candidatus Saganbacteria bacterium]
MIGNLSDRGVAEIKIKGKKISPRDIITYAEYLHCAPDIESLKEKIFFPRHLVLGENDRIYAIGNDYNGKFGRAAIIDPNDGHTILAFGEFTDNDTPYGLWNPRGIATDNEGNIYIANQGPYCVKKFSPEGKFLAQWCARGTEEGEFMNPMGIAVDPRNSDVYVLDSYEPPGKFDLNEQMRVQKFTKDGKFIKKWGERWWVRWPISWNNIKEQLFWAFYIDRSVIMPRIAMVPTIEEPSGIAVDSKGYVYIAERRKYRINKYTSNGRLVKRWGRQGSGPGEFLFDVSGRPIGMAVDADDNVYVVDHENDRVQKFNSNGRFLAEIK